MRKTVIFFFSIFQSKVKPTFASNDDPTGMDFEFQHNEFDTMDTYFNDISNGKFGNLLLEAGGWFENDNNKYNPLQNLQVFSANEVENMISTENDNSNIESDNNLQYYSGNERIEIDSHNPPSSFATNFVPLNNYTLMVQVPNTNEQDGENKKDKLVYQNENGLPKINEITGVLTNNLHPNYPNNNGPSNMLHENSMILDQGKSDMEHLKVLGVNGLIQNAMDFSQRKLDILKGQLKNDFKIVKDFMKAQIIARSLKIQMQMLPSNNEVITKYKEMKNILNNKQKVQLKVPEELGPTISRFEKEANDHIFAVIAGTSHLMNLLQNVLDSLETQNDHVTPIGFETSVAVKDRSFRQWIEYFNRNRYHLRLDELNIPSEVVSKEFKKKQGAPALSGIALVILREENLQQLKVKANHVSIQDKDLVIKNFEQWIEFFNTRRVHLRLDESNVPSEVVGKEFKKKQGTPTLAIIALVILREEILHQAKSSNQNKWNYEQWIQYFNRNKSHLRLDEPKVSSEAVGKEFYTNTFLARKALVNLREELLQELKEKTRQQELTK